MTEAKPISALRRRMIDDMTLRNLSPATQRSYLHAVTKFREPIRGLHQCQQPVCFANRPHT